MIIISLIVLAIIMFVFGFLLGYISRYQLNKSNAGIIHVRKESGKIIYSLELNDDPENLQYKNYVLFKVLIPDEESNRE